MRKHFQSGLLKLKQKINSRKKARSMVMFVMEVL